MDSLPFPRLSKDTIEAAEASFGKRNIYIMIGTAANRLFDGIDLSNLYPQEGVPKEFAYLLSLVTIFQFNEGIADRQAAEATRVRVDWKYALHLPLTHPGLRAWALCDFRQRLRADPGGKHKFQEVLTRLQENCFMPEEPRTGMEAEQVLESVCVHSRLEVIVSTMQMAVQALVTAQPNWLRRIAPPHWYQRYSRELSTLRVPDDLAGQVILAESIGEDGLYLLNAVAQTHSTNLARVIEIRNLKQVWERQFEPRDEHCMWRLSTCPSCMDQLA